MRSLRRSLVVAGVLTGLLLVGPQVASGVVIRGEATPARGVTPGGTTGYSYNLGFDTCSAPTVTVMQSMWNSKPYFDVGIYISGNNRTCAQPNLTSTWVDQVTNFGANGYSLMPLHVGPQASCAFGGPYNPPYISLATATADAQGRSAADEAFNAAVGLGFAAGTVIYYDLEGFDTTNSACVTSVNTFINAWDVQIREAHASHPGVYGSSCASNIQAFASLPNVPDDVWMASTSTPASVWNIPCVSNNSWAIQPPYGRLHQYTATHNETTIDGYVVALDNDCENGLVAPFGHGPNPATPQCP